MYLFILYSYIINFAILLSLDVECMIMSYIKMNNYKYYFYKKRYNYFINTK